MRELGRNDLDGAKQFYEQNKPITSSQAETLVMMQDDSSALIALMVKEDWKIVQDGEKPPNRAQRYMGGKSDE